MNDPVLSLIPRIREYHRSGEAFPFSSFRLSGDEECLGYYADIFRDGSLSVLTARKEGLEKGFYELDITRERLIVSYSDESGLLNAMGTLRQLSAISQGYLFAGNVKDGPSYRHRGLLFDCARHYFPVDYILTLLDAMAVYHLNVFHWHLTDDQGWRLFLPSFPSICSERSYSISDVNIVVERAAKLGIEVIPEIEMPGHVSALLSSCPQIGCSGGPYEARSTYGVFDEVLCMGNEETYEVIRKILNDVHTLFPSSRIVCGGDECPVTAWRGCSRCRDAVSASSLDIEKAQWLFTRRLVKECLPDGMSVILWDDAARFLPSLPVDKNITFLLWRCDEERVRTILENGNRIIVCRHDDGAYLDYKQADDPDEMGNIGVNTLFSSYNMKMYEGEAKITGGQGNLWTEKLDRAEDVNYMLFPRLAALSENFWLLSGEKDFDSFRSRLSSMEKVLLSLGITSDRPYYTDGGAL